MEVEGEFEYNINNEYVKDKDTIVNFYVTSVLEKDTTNAESPLHINDSGMFFIYPEEEIEKRKKIYKIKGKKNIVFQTIKTPLYKGLTWEGYDYSILKNTYTCFVMDTIIQTPAGDFTCFGIRAAPSSSEFKMKGRDIDFC